MIREPLFDTSNLASAIADLRRDLLADGGPRISTMGTYRFAILVYDPAKEFALRRKVRELSDELDREGWNVLPISLHRLLVDRLRREDPEVLDTYVRSEKRLLRRDRDRGLNYLKDKIAAYVEGPEGIARDVVDKIAELDDAHPGAADRTLILLGRAGALYPFFRSSSLLKHIDGKTRGFPVVLLYPGRREGVSALSFMGELAADSDYRPRIYS